MFFGFACLALGYLIYGAGFLPGIFGVLLTIVGVCHLVNSFANFLDAAFAASLFPGLFISTSVAKLSLALWWTVKSIDAVKWKQQAMQA